MTPTEPRGDERECPHYSGTGTGNTDEYRCDSCGIVYRYVDDLDGPISLGWSRKGRREFLENPAPTPGQREGEDG